MDCWIAETLKVRAAAAPSRAGSALQQGGSVDAVPADTRAGARKSAAAEASSGKPIAAVSEAMAR